MNILIENTWKEEFQDWFVRLQYERQMDYEIKSISGEVLEDDLYWRNWGHINSHFAEHFFNLLEEVKINPVLHQKYISIANNSLKFWEFDKEN